MKTTVTASFMSVRVRNTNDLRSAARLDHLGTSYCKLDGISVLVSLMCLQVVLSESGFTQA